MCRSDSIFAFSPLSFSLFRTRVESDVDLFCRWLFEADIEQKICYARSNTTMCIACVDREKREACLRRHHHHSNHHHHHHRDEMK